MFVQPYQLDELQFAYCYRAYFRCQTHRARPQPALLELDEKTFESLLLPYGIHILEAACQESDVRVLASLSPNEAAASCAGKLKGRVSHWLRERLGCSQPEKVLSRGYFACTTGQSTADAVDQYLQQQGNHHGYGSRACPPVFVEGYPLAQGDELRLSPKHAVTILRFHVVLSTWTRKGVFTRKAAEAVTQRWRQSTSGSRFAIEKVSFVPDHVHLALRLHPDTAPANCVVTLMNSAQETVASEFAETMIDSRLNRLWQPSAYVGSYGDLESSKIAGYVRKWADS